VTDIPETHIARSVDGTSLIYQVSGDGPIDLVWHDIGGLPVEVLWEAPGYLRIAKRLGRFSRCVWPTTRGWGASGGDPLDSLDLEVSDADMVAVLDAAAIEKAVLVGWSAACGREIHFSATHPERVSALVVIDGCAHYVREPDYPWGYPRESLDQIAESMKADWGTAKDLEATAPHLMADQGFGAWWSRARRVTFGPDWYAEGWRAALEWDVRPFLPSIAAPTLILHREGDRFIHLGAGQYLAEHIPNAKLIVLPGDDHLFFVGDTDALVDEIEEFLTGCRSGAEGDVLTMTVLFTDIVASTERQARLGQREWSRLTDHHDVMVRGALARHRGHEVKTTGDGFLATFDATGRALRCAADILVGAKDIGLDLRAGLHTGEVEMRGDDIAGLAVTIAKRVCDLAGAGEVLVTRTVTDHVVGSGIEFRERGEQELKGVPGTWRLFSIGG
jgi:class 3 adenylate cyclase/pimeloyl-ACP methyl ester carboxylesterase